MGRVVDPVTTYRFADIEHLAPLTAGGPVPVVLDVERDLGQFEGQVYRHEDFVTVYVVRRGRGVHAVDGRERRAGRGDVFVMPPGTTHTYGDVLDLEFEAVYWHPRALPAAWRDALAGDGLFPHDWWSATGDAPNLWTHLAPHELAAVLDDLADLRRAWRGPRAVDAALVPALLLRLLAGIGRHAAGSAPGPALRPVSRGALHGRANRDAVVAEAVGCIDAGFASPLRIEAVAARVHVSRRQLTAAFAAVMGCTPREYLSHVRLQAARDLLSAGTAPVSQVARACGFEDAAYFSRAFRTATGVAPRTFRLLAAGS